MHLLWAHSGARTDAVNVTTSLILNFPIYLRCWAQSKVGFRLLLWFSQDHKITNLQEDTWMHWIIVITRLVTRQKTLTEVSSDALIKDTMWHFQVVTCRVALCSALELNSLAWLSINHHVIPRWSSCVVFSVSLFHSIYPLKGLITET